MVKRRVKILSGWRYSLVKAAMAVNVICLALMRFRNPVKTFKALQNLRRKAKNTGYVFPRYVRNGNKYYGNLSVQGWPSEAYNRYIRFSFDQVIQKETNSIHLAIFSITHSCGFQCHHCLEWDRLNSRSDLSVEQILKVINNLHKNGVSQIMFSGGEPMNRLRDLLEVLKCAPKGIEFWMFTSGFSVTREKADQLKKSGLTGMIISIDHVDPEKHDTFRGVNGSHAKALNAIEHALIAGLVPAVSCCATNEFVSEQNVRDYMEMARQRGVAFVQFLEPKAVGRYSGQPVALGREKQKILEELYKDINFSPANSDYPLITYIDFLERTHGCVAHGVNIMYIDAEGYAQSCPFCRGQKFSLLQEEISDDLLNMKRSACNLSESNMILPTKSTLAMP